jgi:tetratricopeptide (TPR) repeat protein
LNIDNLLKIQDQIITNVCSILGGYYGLIIRKGAMTYRKNALNITAFDAALWQYHFHMNFSQEVYLETRQILEEVVRQDPNYAMGLAMLSELYLDAYSLGYPTIENPIEEAYRLAKKAIKIDPQCQHAHQQYGWVNLYMKRKQEALTYMEKSLAINPSSVSTMGAIGFGMACAGEYERAHQLLTRSLNLNPHCPWWFYLGFFLIYYSDKQYIKALEYANKIEATDVFLEPLTRAVVKLQLGLHLEARNDAETLASNFPEIKANLQTYLSTFLLDNSLINNFIEVIHKIDTK